VRRRKTKRFNEEAATLEGVDILTFSMDLPLRPEAVVRAPSAWIRWKMISDHKDGSFGSAYGTLISPSAHYNSRAIFVLG
jgi:thiol peroxidase